MFFLTIITFFFFAYVCFLRFLLPTGAWSSPAVHVGAGVCLCPLGLCYSMRVGGKIFVFNHEWLSVTTLLL